MIGAITRKGYAKRFYHESIQFFQATLVRDSVPIYFVSEHPPNNAVSMWDADGENF